MRPRITIEQLRNTACAKLNPHLFPPEPEKKEKRSKYNNRKTEVDGIEFDSEKEANRYKELKLLLKIGEIGMIAKQVEFALHNNGEKIASYIADFVYLEIKTGKQIVEDVKSEATRKLPVYRLKKKLMKSIYKITIKEY